MILMCLLNLTSELNISGQEWLYVEVIGLTDWDTNSGDFWYHNFYPFDQDVIGIQRGQIGFSQTTNGNSPRIVGEIFLYEFLHLLFFSYCHHC